MKGLKKKRATPIYKAVSQDVGAAGGRGEGGGGGGGVQQKEETIVNAILSPPE